MLKIHKSHSKKLLLIPTISICIVAGLLGFYYLTYIPELSHAETITYEPPKETRTMDNITYMQEITPEICQNSELNKQYTLTDIRDNNTYTVARIKNQTNSNSNCWMTQNLRLTNYTLTSDDSDVDEQYILSASVTLNTNNKPSQFSSSDVHQSIVYYFNDSHGAYYNWYTATAGTGKTTAINSDNNAPNSICPKKWRLPTSGSNGEFKIFLDQLKGSVITSTPYKFMQSGYIALDSLKNFNEKGYYWSSTVQNPSYINILTFTFSSIIAPSAGVFPYYGSSIRCVTSGKSFSNENIQITVSPTISLDVAEEVNIEKSEANPSTANLDVEVSSNQKYSVGISTTNPNLTSSTNNVTIPAKSGLLNTAENGWGIKLKNDADFTALTSDLQTFYTASGAEIKTIPFTIGISTAPDLPNGEYSTDIAITATQN